MLQSYWDPKEKLPFLAHLSTISERPVTAYFFGVTVYIGRV